MSITSRGNKLLKYTVLHPSKEHPSKEQNPSKEWPFEPKYIIEVHPSKELRFLEFSLIFCEQRIFSS